MMVVDTNVVAYLWLPGTMTAMVERVLAADGEWAVPVLWRSEFRSVLAGAVTHKTCSLKRAVDIAAAAESQFANREFAVDSAQVLTLASESGCSAYDCEFVALAMTLGVRLVTNDREVLRAFAGVAVPLTAFA